MKNDNFLAVVLDFPEKQYFQLQNKLGNIFFFITQIVLEVTCVEFSFVEKCFILFLHKINVSILKVLLIFCYYKII